MNNFIKSILLSFVIVFAPFYIIGVFFNGNVSPTFIIGISIIATVIFCTYKIIDTIKNTKNL